MKYITHILLMLLCIPLSASTPQVLHYGETTGYNHGTRDESMAMFYQMCQWHGWQITEDNSGSEFNSVANLLQYEVVIFSNTSGNSGLNATQRANFEAYIDSGGSYLGIHAASDTYRHSSANGGSKGTWDWYAETVAGATVQQNPNHTSQNHNNDITQPVAHPVTTAIPNPWNKTEEYYYWENGYLSPAFTEILRVGQTGSNSRDAPRMVAHCRNLPGGGKAFYTSLGHAASNFETNPIFYQLIEDAMIWIMPPSTPFFIDFSPVREIAPELEAGYFYLDEVPIIRDYFVYDITGRQVESGLVDDQGRVPHFTKPGIWTYKTYSRRWVGGVR